MSARATRKGQARAALIACAVAVAGCQGTIAATGDDARGADTAAVANDVQRAGPDAVGTPPPRDGDTPADAAMSPTDGGATDAGSGRIPIFVAQGFMGRSTISCDDGRTWVADRAFDSEGDPLVCGMARTMRCDHGGCSYLRDGTCLNFDTCDCGHHPGFGKGVTYGDGWFVATWGWGTSGSVRRSRDGVHWEDTLSQAVGGAFVGFGGVAYGNGRFVLSSRDTYTSADGSHWAMGHEADFRGLDGGIVWSVRDFNFIADPHTPRFIASASPPDDVLISDDGVAWRRPAARPDPCVESSAGVVYGNGITVAVGSDGRVCTSTDAGDHWTQQSGVGSTTLYSRKVLWTGTEFVVWGEGADYDTRMYRSADGVHWTGTVTDPPRIRPSVVARNPETGTFATSGNVWSGYEEQRFYRSADGVHWQALPDGAFRPSHNIFEMTFGYAEPSTVCPGH